MSKNLLVREEINYLEVYSGQRKLEIATEIEPIQIGFCQTDRETWQNGPTTYERWIERKIFVIRWNSQFRLIETYEQQGNYPDPTLSGWSEITKIEDSLIVNY